MYIGGKIMTYKIRIQRFQTAHTFKQKYEKNVGVSQKWIFFF